MIIIMFKNKIINSNNSDLRSVFTIECKDIILREFQLEDLDAIYNITLQPEIREFLPDWIATKEKRRERCITITNSKKVNGNIKT